MRTQNLLGMDFCQKLVSGIQFDLPGTDIKNPPKSICFSSFHQNKYFCHSSQIFTIRAPYTMCIDAKGTRCWKYWPIDTHIHFPLGSTFQPNQKVVATVLSFINTLCTRSERNLPILRENYKYHWITLPKGRIGFFSLDVLDRDEPKYHIRSPYDPTNAIIYTDDRYSVCFFFHSTVPAQTTDEFLQILYVTEDSILQQPNSLDMASLLTGEWAKVLLTSYSTESLVLDQHAAKQDFSWDKSTLFGIQKESVTCTTW